GGGFYDLTCCQASSSTHGDVPLGQAAKAVAQTTNSTVTQVMFRWIDENDLSVHTEIVPLSLGSALSTFIPNEVGRWTVEADFGNGVILYRTLFVPFFVIPESPIGVLAMTLSS